MSASIELVDKESLRKDIKNLMGKAVGGDAQRAARRGGVRAQRAETPRRDLSGERRGARTPVPSRFFRKLI